ncbi:SpoIID/LytB domain-containing protein [Candidatus Gottesmanbacteria bacterium]|nr:SpoIID/LytB domain-containing protein [Candidatus Gottesmanbacteria bacterium]
MKKVVQFLSIALLLYSIVGFVAPRPVFAVECDPSTIQAANNDSLLNDINKVCQEALQSMEKAVKPHRDELRKMEAAIRAFQARIKTLEANVAKKTIEIAIGEKELEGFLSIASSKIRHFYIRSFTTHPIALFLSSANIGSVLRTIGYQQAVINEDKKVIAQTALSVKELEDKKKALEGEKATLAILKADTDRRAVSVRKLVADADAYQSKLQSLIAQISSRQQEFLGEKLAGLNIPRSAGLMGGCVDDRPIDPGFSPRFAMFTFGVPNRVGMNQWGAKGRADAGQGYDQILHAYYTFDGYQNFDTNLQIKVNNGNSINNGNIIWSGSLEDYMKRIYEVPVGWPIDSLRAQAVAARSYVLAATNNGSGSICANQWCQVFQTNPKGGTWEQAVNDTAGKVMVQGGNPIKAWYSSTHGGYVFSSGDLQGWSSTPWTKRAIDASSSINSFSDLFSSAFDRGSPWFYCDWGSRASYKKTAWLKPEELADIVNVILLARQDSSTREHLYQPDKPNPAGTDTWDAGRVKSELGSGAFNNISDLSVDWDRGTGRTTQVHVSGDAGSRDFDGAEFRNFFNLRAPANIQIVGPLFNVEKR